MIHRIASLGILLCLAACQLEDPQQGLRTAEVLTLQAQDSVLLADGQDLTVLTAQLGPQAAANQVVAFSTNQGYFESSEGGNPQTLSRLASAKEASAVLVASTEATARVLVSASVTGLQQGEPVTFQAERVLRFQRAYPQELTLALEEARLAAQPGQSTILNLTLSRSTGQVSGGTEVFFSAQPLEANGPQLELPASAVADAATLSVSVVNPDTLSGSVRIRAWVLDEQRDTAAVASTNLTVLP